MARYRVGLQTRERILAATRELLGEVGFDGVTLKAITDRAGVGAGSFYNLFDSKEQAVLEVVRDAITAVDPDPSGLGRETVADLVDAFVAFFTSPETATVARIYLQLAFAGGLTDEALASRVRRSHRTRVARFADAVARERPDLDATDARACAERLLAGLLGAAVTWLLDDSVDLEGHAVALRSAVVPEQGAHAPT
ncbi:MAG: TetR/AcrR family transcriptional regulator [Actinomycetes bacterium]